ncbi:MAG TPA: DUF4159 domain-containing protein [Candidatus Krumholzibacteria bacterium]|nr:DUF4159 domain-containing protein [Candidatus Krumholzibacteria bacterium]HPD72337.1 DUF4159 domain-containing protein [Candidatus Krumholzibacteria bacterium]HRY40731.1 DUF4159 domain-containing protein [Candidatus Krumholzibacteria bacterium]
MRRADRVRQPLIAAVLAMLALGAGAPAAPDAAQRPETSGDEAEIRVARLRYPGGGDWYCNPSSLPNWLEEFRRRTGVPTAATEAVVSLDSEDLYRYPLLYLSGHGRIALDDLEVGELRRWLDAGGFLWADDNYGLDPSFRELIAQLYPEQPLEAIGSDHPIYAAFYDLPGLPKIHVHDGDPAQGFGIQRDGRLVLFYTWSSDIGDGLEDPDVHGDPPEVREAAARMACNILMYALTHP